MPHYFEPYILSTETQEHVPVRIEEMTSADAESTHLPPVWQTDWTSDFISNPEYLKYAVRTPLSDLRRSCQAHLSFLSVLKRSDFHENHGLSPQQ